MPLTYLKKLKNEMTNLINESIFFFDEIAPINPKDGLRYNEKNVAVTELEDRLNQLQKYLNRFKEIKNKMMNQSTEKRKDEQIDFTDYDFYHQQLFGIYSRMLYDLILAKKEEAIETFHNAKKNHHYNKFVLANTAFEKIKQAKAYIECNGNFFRAETNTRQKNLDLKNEVFNWYDQISNYLDIIANKTKTDYLLRQAQNYANDVETSLSFFRQAYESASEDKVYGLKLKTVCLKKQAAYYLRLYDEFKQAYQNPNVIDWLLEGSKLLFAAGDLIYPAINFPNFRFTAEGFCKLMLDYADKLNEAADDAAKVELWNNQTVLLNKAADIVEFLQSFPAVNFDRDKYSLLGTEILQKINDILKQQSSYHSQIFQQTFYQPYSYYPMYSSQPVGV